MSDLPEQKQPTSRPSSVELSAGSVVRFRERLWRVDQVNDGVFTATPVDGRDLYPRRFATRLTLAPGGLEVGSYVIRLIARDKDGGGVTRPVGRYRMSRVAADRRGREPRSVSTQGGSGQMRIAFGDGGGGVPPRPSRWRRLSLATIGVGLALASSIVALMFTLFPGLKPDPGEKFAAEVSIFAIDRHVSLRDYLQRTNSTPQEIERRRSSTAPAPWGFMARSSMCSR